MKDEKIPGPRVVAFTPKTPEPDPYADIAVKDVLHNAPHEELGMVAVIGWYNDGTLYCASSTSDIPQFEHMLNRALMTSIMDTWTDLEAE